MYILNLKVWALVLIDTTSGIVVGRPYGNLAILIRKSLRKYCNFLFYDDPRIMGLEYKNF